MGSMHVRMRGEQAVPIMIAHRTVSEPPKVKRTRSFVGIKQGLSNLLSQAVGLIHESFWEVEEEVLDAGKSSVTNYAIQVNDPPGAGEPELVVTRLDGEARPGCGAYFEVINVDMVQEDMRPPEHPDSKAKAVGTRPSPENTRMKSRQ